MPTEKENALGTRIVREKKKKNENKSWPHENFCQLSGMENKNTNTSETAKVRQTIKWNKFRNRWERVDIVRKENNVCATRLNGRKFFGRYDANGNYHDVSWKNLSFLLK